MVGSAGSRRDVAEVIVHDAVVHVRCAVDSFFFLLFPGIMPILIISTTLSTTLHTGM